MQEFAESGQLVLRCSFPLSGGVRRVSNHKNAEICADVYEDLRVSQSARYLQSSPEMVS